MRTYDDISYALPMRLNKEWTMSPTLVAHNCLGEREVNNMWCHTSRYDTPLVCYGCGAIAPKQLEEIFRDVLLLGGNSPDKLVPPFTFHDGRPGAQTKYEAWCVAKETYEGWIS